MEKLTSIMTTDEFVQYAINLAEDRIITAGGAFLPGTSISVGYVLPPDYLDEGFYNNIDTWGLETIVAERASQELVNRGYEVTAVKSEKLYPRPGWHYDGESCWHKHPVVGLKIARPMEKGKVKNGNKIS